MERWGEESEVRDGGEGEERGEKWVVRGKKRGVHEQGVRDGWEGVEGERMGGGVGRMGGRGGIGECT